MTTSPPFATVPAEHHPIMPEPLIAPRLLFRYRLPLRYRQSLWKETGIGLGEDYRLPDLCQLDDERSLADVRMAWNEQGLAVTAEVRGKQQPLWCHTSRPEESDALQLWIDTRATDTIHRAGRFCQRLVFLPAGGGRDQREPLADQLLIRHARENAHPIRPAALHVRSEIKRDGYLLEAMIPAAALTGFDPAEHPRLGFTYALYDRELGLQTFSAGTAVPYEEDPSMWATLELVR
jgi:hypothetical protein